MSFVCGLDQLLVSVGGLVPHLSVCSVIASHTILLTLLTDPFVLEFAELPYNS